MHSAVASLSPQAKKSLRAWLDRLGALLGIAGVAFVIYRLYGYFGEFDFRRFGPWIYVAAALLAVLYGASNLLLTFGWRAILCHLGVDAGRDWTIWAYATSQLAKYVPGNVFQFAGRQALGVAAGIGNGPLAKSTLIELAMLTVGGALFLPLLVQHFVPASGPFTAPLVFVALACGALFLTYCFGGAALARAAAFYLAFLVVAASIFIATLALVQGQTSASGAFPLIIGAYVIAWLVGLLTPGAPAGLGIREAVLLALLSGIADGPVILVAVLTGRIVNVLGDLMFYAAGRARAR